MNNAPEVGDNLPNTQDGAIAPESTVEVVASANIDETETTEEVDLTEELGISTELADHIAKISETHLVRLTPLENDEIKMTVIDYSLEENFTIKELLEKEKEVGSNFIIVGKDIELVEQLDARFTTKEAENG